MTHDWPRHREESWPVRSYRLSVIGCRSSASYGVGPLSSYWHFFWLQVTFWLTVVVPAALLTSTDTEPLVRRP